MNDVDTAPTPVEAATAEVCLLCGAFGIEYCRETVGACKACGLTKDVYVEMDYSINQNGVAKDTLCLDCIDSGRGHLTEAHKIDKSLLAFHPDNRQVSETPVSTPVEATWPVTRYEETMFSDWQDAVGNGDTFLGFRDFLTQQEEVDGAPCCMDPECKTSPATYPDHDHTN